MIRLEHGDHPFWKIPRRHPFLDYLLMKHFLAPLAGYGPLKNGESSLSLMSI